MSPRILAAVMSMVACASTLLTGLATQEQPLKTIREGVLDRIELFVDRPPRAADSIVAIKPFTTEGANLGTGLTGTPEERKAAKIMRVEAPRELEAALMKELAWGGGCKGVVRDGTGDLVIEGSFTDINPGSLPKKGDLLGERSVMAVAGTVRDGSAGSSRGSSSGGSRPPACSAPILSARCARTPGISATTSRSSSNPGPAVRA